MKWSIVTDSSSDLTLEEGRALGIEFTSAPLRIVIGEKEYVDRDGVDLVSMVADMKAEKRASSSACPSPGDFAEAFKKADKTICVTMTSALSATYQSAVLAQAQVLEEHPEKQIHIVDSKATAGVMVLLVRKAAELIHSGIDFEQVAQKMDDYNKTIRLVFTLGSYDNLVKSGRMNAFAGMLAGHLGIRAVAINTPQGEISVVKKVRGVEKTIQAMVDIMKETADIATRPVIISHSNNLEMAQQAKAMIEAQCQVKNITLMTCKALTTFYTMGNGVLIAL
jgi:DegV family protein with EDD domain